MNSFDVANRVFFESSVRSALKEGKVVNELVELIPEKMMHAFNSVTQELGIQFPIRFRLTDIISDQWLIREQSSGKVKAAFFEPKLSGDKITAGEMVIHQPFLLYAARSQERKGGRQFTPWNLISDVAHEAKHGQQWQNNIDWVRKDMELPYWAQEAEREARVYSLDFLSRQRPWGVWDRVDRAFIALDIRQDIKKIDAERKRLGLR